MPYLKAKVTSKNIKLVVKYKIVYDTSDYDIIFNVYPENIAPFSKVGGIQYLHIQTNREFYITQSNSDTWLQVSKELIDNTYKVTLEASPNNFEEDRSTTLTFKDIITDFTLHTIQVTQLYNDLTLYWNPSSLEFLSEDTETKIVNIISISPWRIYNNYVDEIKITPIQGGEGNFSIRVTPLQNNDSIDKEISIEAQNDSDTSTLTIIHVGKREIFSKDFRLSDGSTFNVLKETP